MLLEYKMYLQMNIHLDIYRYNLWSVSIVYTTCFVWFMFASLYALLWLVCNSALTRRKAICEEVNRLGKVWGSLGLQMRYEGWDGLCDFPWMPSGVRFWFGFAGCLMYEFIVPVYRPSGCLYVFCPNTAVTRVRLMLRSVKHLLEMTHESAEKPESFWVDGLYKTTSVLFPELISAYIIFPFWGLPAHAPAAPGSFHSDLWIYF